MSEESKNEKPPFIMKLYEVKSVYEDGIVKGMKNKRNDNDDSNGEIKW